MVIVIMDKVMVSHGRGDEHRYGHAVPVRNNHLDHNHDQGHCHRQTCGHDKDLYQFLPTSRRKATSYAVLTKQPLFFSMEDFVQNPWLTRHFSTLAFLKAKVQIFLISCWN